jgi:hypothetical protein
MKRNLLLLLLIFISYAGFSQIVSDPENVEASGDVNITADIEADYHLTNEFEVTKNLLWRINTIDAPEAWKFYLCDANLCYGPGENQSNPSKPNVLEPDSIIPMAFHILNFGETGVGNYEVQYFDMDAPNQILITVPITINAISTSLKEVALDEINIFPNPASDYFSMTENNLITQISIFNIVGKQVKTFNAVNNGSYSIADLSDGMYLVRLIDNKGKVAKVLRISKR